MNSAINAQLSDNAIHQNQHLAAFKAIKAEIQRLHHNTMVRGELELAARIWQILGCCSVIDLLFSPNHPERLDLTELIAEISWHCDAPLPQIIGDRIKWQKLLALLAKETKEFEVSLRWQTPTLILSIACPIGEIQRLPLAEDSSTCFTLLQQLARQNNVKVDKYVKDCFNVDLLLEVNLDLKCF